jgi:hypothetical protein
MRYVLPFHFVFEPMERLAVISFKGDEEYEGIEPQFFDDPVNGKGIRLLRYRKDKKVDVYYEAGMTPEENLSIGAGINDSKVITFEKNTFEVTKQGLQVHVVFTDAQGRKNELKVTEKSTRKYPVPMLAPIGGVIEKPQKLFFVYMKDIDFAYYKTTQINCSIGGRVLEPAAVLPLIIKGHRTYLVRYCSELRVVALNGDGTDPLCFDGAPGKTVIQDGTEIICNTQGKVEHIQIGKGTHTAKLYFPDGFPDLQDLPENQDVIGPFDIYIFSKKIIGGQYRLKRVADKVHVDLNNFSEWQPKRYPFAYKLLFTFMKVFTKWPTYFSWKGVVDLQEIPRMDGAWDNRIDGKSKVV